MQTYIFILGRDPELSRLELFSYLNSRSIGYKILDSSDIALVLDASNFNPEIAISELGGTQKIAQVIKSFNNLYTGTKNKVNYAISNYSDGKDINDRIKEYFKKEGIRATLKKSHHRQEFLTPSEAKDLIEIIQYKEWTAKVVAVFDPKVHKFRDEKRPVMRPLHTISIRLAKILINLSGIKPGQTLLDPFCGIGTILQEAMLMKVNVIGVDKEKSCIFSSEKNLSWVKAYYNSQSNYKLFNIDCRQLSKYISKVDCVATEPYMGPFFKSYPTEGEAKKVLQELLPLYTELIRELSKVTKNKIVIVTPTLLAKSKQKFRLNLEPILNKYQLKYEKPIPYKSPTSKILREIWVINI